MYFSLARSSARGARIGPQNQDTVERLIFFYLNPPSGEISFPPKNLPFFSSQSLSLSWCASLVLFSSPFIHRLLAVSPRQKTMDLTARCVLLLGCLRLTSAVGLEAIEPGYYVEASAASDVIDYKDPCKAGKEGLLFFLCNGMYLFFYVEVKHATNCVFCWGASARSPCRGSGGSDSVVDVVLRGFMDTTVLACI